AGGEASREEVVHLGDDVEVARRFLHRGRCALHVHQADRDVESGDGLQGAGGLQAADVVHHRGSGGGGGAHHLRLAGVDRDRYLDQVGEHLDDGQHAVELLVDGHGTGAGTGGLPTDVEQVGALGD